MPLKYKCEECGTPLGYEGLCWRCKTQKERAEILSWSKDKIAKTQEHLEQNIEKLDNYENPENAMFRYVLLKHLIASRFVSFWVQIRYKIERIFLGCYEKCPNEILLTGHL